MKWVQVVENALNIAATGMRDAQTDAASAARRILDATSALATSSESFAAIETTVDAQATADSTPVEDQLRPSGVAAPQGNSLVASLVKLEVSVQAFSSSAATFAAILEAERQFLATQVDESV